MSDKIKSEYNKYAEEIKPSEEFTSRLTRTLKEERARKKYSKLKYLKPFAAAAACLIIALAAGLALNRGLSHSVPSERTSAYNERPTSGIGNQAGEINTNRLNISDIENIGWYNGALNAESLPLALAEKLGSSLDYLVFSGENKFVGAENADAETLERIKALLGSARETDERASGEKIYYMAVFTDGTVAKFSVADGKFLEISGDKKIYLKTEN
ncbi:MAG: hypothetical protein NC223_04310 [Butyrivibrio sp.]|nr:hypothetical protein [Butyrivibrio sp.]